MSHGRTVSAWHPSARLKPFRARRLAVRTSAANDAFFARAERSSGVMFLPCRPNMRAISVMAARKSGQIFVPWMGTPGGVW